MRRRYCAIVNPIRRHVAGLSAKPLTILTACLIWVLAIVLAMPAAFFSYVPTVPLQSNHSILICSPFPEEFGEYFTSNEYPLSGKRIFHLSKKKKTKIIYDQYFNIYLESYAPSRIVCIVFIYISFRIAGQSYQKGMVMFKFLAYYAIPLLVITGFYLGMARHLELSTRNMPGELSTGCHRMEQIKARKKVRWKEENNVYT